MDKRKPAFEGSKKIIAVEMDDESTNKSSYNYIYTNVDIAIYYDNGIEHLNNA